MRTLAMVVALLSSAGCYFEGSIAYHPRISQALASDTGSLVDTSGGWSGSVNIGFYLDVAVPEPRFKGIGIGWSPSSFNGYGIAPAHHGGLVRTASRGNSFRTDISLPLRGWPYIEERLTFTYNALNDTSATLLPDTMPAASTSSHGHVWFLGPSLALRMPLRTSTGSPTDFVLSITLGVERFAGDVELEDMRTVRVSSTGIGARFMFIPAFVGNPPSRDAYDAGTSTNQALPDVPDQVKCHTAAGANTAC